MAPLVKHPPAMRETWVQSLRWEDLLEKGKATHSSILAWRIPWTTAHEVAKSQTRLSELHIFDVQCCISFWCEQSDSIMHVGSYTYFFIFFSILVYYRVLSIVPSAIQWDLVFLFYTW